MRVTPERGAAFLPAASLRAGAFLPAVLAATLAGAFAAGFFAAAFFAGAGADAFTSFSGWSSSFMRTGLSPQISSRW